MATSKTSKIRLKAIDRRLEALDLRRRGLTYQSIGAALGISESRAWQLVTGELSRLRAELDETTDAVRTLELERLDMLLAAHMPKALGADIGVPDDKAAATCLRIMERRARLLGLDRPVAVDAGDTILRVVMPEGFTLAGNEGGEQ